MNDYLITFHHVDVNALANSSDIRSTTGRIRLMAELINRPDQHLGLYTVEDTPLTGNSWLDASLISLNIPTLLANTDYAATAKWLLDHKDKWDELNVVIVTLEPNLPVHTLVTNRDNSKIVYDTENELCKKPVLRWWSRLNGYFVPVTELIQLG